MTRDELKKCKIGDRLRIIVQISSNYNKIGTIVGFELSTGNPQVLFDDGNRYCYSIVDLVLVAQVGIPTLYQGDRVRVISKKSTHFNRIGKVIGRATTFPHRITVEFSSGGISHFKRSSLEIVALATSASDKAQLGFSTGVLKEEFVGMPASVKQNNDGRDTCYSCGSPTKQVEGMLSIMSVCTVCKK